MDRVLADLTGLLHAGFIVFLVAGGVACLRWPHLLRWHLPAVIAMATVNRAGLGCPLTVVQKHFLERAGDVPYRGGFVEHYLVDPVYPDGITAAVRALIITSWVLPTAIAYGLLAYRRRATAA